MGADKIKKEIESLLVEIKDEQELELVLTYLQELQQKKSTHEHFMALANKVIAENENLLKRLAQ
ncbi:MAG: hypothetical protein IT270_05960 [Saprospiraceae bacterium]|nr:hypothetical protein [Saprospiraceae bacterium]